MNDNRHDLIVEGIQGFAPATLVHDHLRDQGRMKLNPKRSSGAANHILGTSDADRQDRGTTLLGNVGKPWTGWAQ